MKSIQIDDDVYAYLQEKAIPFEEATPGMTLRRLLGLGRPPVRRAAAGRRAATGRRQEKADLEVLLSADLLKPGEALELRDYQGRRIEGAQATVAGSKLVYNGRKYSMSALAAMLLKKNGYKGASVRGPAHWFTQRGRSVKDLWEDLLAS